MELFDFAYFPKWAEALNHLAQNLAMPETWDYTDKTKEYAMGNTGAQHDYPILRSYLEYTFKKLKTDNKISKTDDAKYAAFNTGLVTNSLEEIFAFFEKNKNTTGSPYFFKAFIKKSDRDYINHFSDRYPETADYFQKPELLIFNPKLQVIPDFEHIIGDNNYRFKDDIKTLTDSQIRMRVVGAFDDISKRVKYNYKLAIPQFFASKIQLLLPLCLSDHIPDLVMVLEKINHTTYSARTCLTMGMAYNNARLIVKPESEWLKP